MRVTVGRTSVLSLQLLVLIGLTAFGCKEKPSQALLTETTPQLNAPSRTPRAPAAQDDTLDDMAAQTERDVDFLLAHQREDGSIGVEAASTPGAVETTPAPKPQPAPPPPPRKVVVWNDAPQRLPATDLPNPAADTAATADPDPTPDDLPPAFPDSGQGNLFRDPPAPVEVQDMKQAGPSAGDPALSADQLRVLAVELRKELHKRKAWSDQPVREVLAMAMLSIIDPELKVNPDAFRVDLTESERELVGNFQEFCTALGTDLNDDVHAEEALIDAVAALQAALVEEPELELPATAMCWRVGGFGDFDEFGRYVFLAHSTPQFILYTEVDRFTSELNKKQQWVTEISLQFEIIADRDGIPVWSEPWQKFVDVTSKQRRDFFIAQIVTLPEALSIGQYHFKIRARDEKSGAEAETSLPFEMVADPKLAARIPAK